MSIAVPIRRWARGLPGSDVLRFARDLALGGDRRRTTLLARSKAPGLFQPTGFTQHNRYPLLFAEARALAGYASMRRLLSFGCSTGEEVLTLRQYFPDAFIKGLDIDAHRIAECHRRSPAGEMLTDYAVAASADGEASASFDAVFALAVLRHGDLGEAPESCTHLLRFSAFEAAITSLVTCLRPGGLLVVRHANFRVEDASGAAALVPLLLQPTRSPRYGRDERRIMDDARETVIFRKMIPLPSVVAL